MAAKDVNYANTFKNVRTALLYTQAPTLKHIDMVWPNPSECYKVNTMLFSKWLADPVRFGCFHTLGGDREGSRLQLPVMNFLPSPHDSRRDESSSAF